MTLNIMTFSITTLSTMTHSITTLSIMTFSIMILKGDPKHNVTQHDSRTVVC